MLFHRFFAEKTTPSPIDEPLIASMSPKRKLERVQDPVTATEAAKSDSTAIETTSSVKSRKQLRLERKAAKKAASAPPVEPEPTVPMTKEEIKAEKNRLRKERRNQLLLEQERLHEKELKKERKLLKDKKRHRQMNAPGSNNKEQPNQKQKKVQETQASTNRDREILNNVLHGSTDETTGTTTLRLGVQYKDVVVGTGPAVQNRSLVTVAYKLRAKGSVSVIDSSKNFKFRVGKGEVIQGWDIGVVGMQQGGKRTLIVPPKAGYGSQDIGGGAGATLQFEITVIAC